MNSNKVTTPETHEGFLSWLFKILAIPISIYKFLFQKGNF